mgnify:CR=1 FL=1
MEQKSDIKEVEYLYETCQTNQADFHEEKDFIKNIDKVPKLDITRTKKFDFSEDVLWIKQSNIF